MINERLSRDIEAGARARPRYSTDVITTDSGYEVRNQRWVFVRFEFEFDLEPGDRGALTDEIQEFVNLWHAAAGQYDTFLFRDPFDWNVTGQNFGTGDGVTTVFQLYRVYQAGATTRLRKITRPVAGSATIYVNGVVTAATIDASTGTVTFAGAPANGAQLTADFQYNVPVRFADDALELVSIASWLEKPVNVTLIEIKE